VPGQTESGAARAPATPTCCRLEHPCSGADGESECDQAKGIPPLSKFACGTLNEWREGEGHPEGTSSPSLTRVLCRGRHARPEASRNRSVVRPRSCHFVCDLLEHRNSRNRGAGADGDVRASFLCCSVGRQSCLQAAFVRRLGGWRHIVACLP